ncbi:MAG: hypothetical protein RLZZ453_982 [Chlamydiota bacterium]
MIKYVCLVCTLFTSMSFASVESLKLLHQRQTNTYGSDWTYHEDTEEHRQEFFKWIASHGLWDSYARVILTVGCRDADYIPKCPDAGKVFYVDNQTSYQVMHNGVKVVKDCYYGNWMTDLIYGLKGHHEPQEEKAFYEVLKHIPSNAVMIELGSYWAYYSLWFAKTIPQAQNYLVEPDPERLNIGKRNFALNGLTGTFIHGYVGECNDDSGNSQDASSVFIDSFLESNNIEHVNILHSDIQGSEYAMLQSAVKSIHAKKIDYLFISTHSQQLQMDCINFLESCDYVILTEHSPGESFSVDGLIVAKRSDLVGCEKISISKNR